MSVLSVAVFAMSIYLTDKLILVYRIREKLGSISSNNIKLFQKEGFHGTL